MDAHSYTTLNYTGCIGLKFSLWPGLLSTTLRKYTIVVWLFEICRIFLWRIIQNYQDLLSIKSYFFMQISKSQTKKCSPKRFLEELVKGMKMFYLYTHTVCYTLVTWCGRCTVKCRIVFDFLSRTASFFLFHLLPPEFFISIRLFVFSPFSYVPFFFK